ncbi:MAG: hypothetical protein AABX51_02685 [Nanoarchaeota archaeon]
MLDHPWERSLDYLTDHKFMHWAGYTQNSAYDLGIAELKDKSFFLDKMF